MKKITALLLAIILVAGSVSVYAAEGFENTSSSWTISSGAPKIDDGTGNHVIELTGKDGKGIINKARKSGILSIQFEFKADESQNSAVLPEVYGIGKDGKEFKILEVLLKDNMVSFVCGTKENNIRANAETIVNQNNTVTVEIDTEKSLASVWLNGTPVAVNRKFINNTEIVSVSKVALRNTSSSSSVYIDNIEYIAEPAKGVERSVEIPEEDIIVSETFDGNDYSVKIPAGMETVSRLEAKTDNDMCLKISPATVGNYLNIALNSYSGIFTYRFEVMTEGTPNQVVLGELSGGGRLIPLSAYQKYVSVAYGGGSRQNTSLSESTWTTVEVQADSNENKFSLWIDNKLILDKADFFQNAKPGKFSLIQFGTKYENEPPIYVDNITVYKGERVEIVQKETYDVASALEKTEVFKKDSGIKYLSNYRKESTGVSFEENGELYVPLNEACEGFGIEYGYSSFDETAYISYQGNSVKVPANKDYIVFNDAKTDLKTKTVIKDGVLFAALSDAGKILSKEVYYNSENGLGYLTLEVVKDGEELSSVNEFVLSLYGEELLPDKELYVSINAKNSGDGSKDAPFKTIEEAKAEVKKLIAGKQTGNITVYVGEGTYYITQPLKFGSSDSHSGNYTVTYKKCDGENNPLIDAGERITGWKFYKNGIYVANLPKGVNPLTLSEDGKRVTIARHPNEGYNRLDAADGGASKTDFKFREGVFPKVENPLELKWTIWPGSESGEINYSTNRELKTVEFDYSTRKVKIGSSATYVLGTGSRYYVYNAMEFLDEKGENYVDTKESKIYYKPISDDIEKAVIVMPADYNAVEFKGSGTKYAQNIVFDGIDVTGTNVKKNLIDIANARNIVVRNSKLYFSGNNGVNIGTNTSNCTVESNEIKGMGFYGIYAIGSGNGELNCYGHRIINNHIDMAYLLKPTRYNELLNAVQNAKQTLDNMQEDEDISPLIVRQFLFDIYTGALQNEEVIKKRLMSINVEPDSIGKPCVLARFNVKDYNEYLKNIWSHGVDGFCTALFQIFQQQSNGLFVSVFNLVGDTFLAVVLSNGDIADLPSARRIFDKAVGNVKEILCAEISYTILGEYPELLKLAAVQPKDSKEEFCGTICHYMGIGNINEIENILDIGKEYFSGIPLNDVKDFVKLTFARLDEMYESIGDFSEEIKNEINDIMAIDNFESVWELFTGSLCDLALRTQKFSKNNGNAIAKRAKEYVNQNYNLDVSLEGLSKILCLEPTYVSKLFKKETGQNFIDYLISVRMEKAKELLESTNHKVYTISMSVGYKKIKYFYKVFKKYTGYTPTEYRNMLFGGGEEK